MTTTLINQIRIEQTCSEVNYLENEIEKWIHERKQKDKLNQYHTQLENLKAVLTCCLSALRTGLQTELGDGSTKQSVGEVYEVCSQFDERLVFVRRIWTYFREKFDQRDNPLLGPVLAAADEIVWSCYTEVFQNSGIPQEAVPLPYIEPRYSPEAIPRDSPPPNLKSDTFLQQYLKALPIPVVSLPPVCVRAPWWLIYIGHEVGHHVQYDLLEKWQLVGNFQQLLESAVADEATGQRWGQWGREIFADVFSILMMGPSAVWAMAELEMASDRKLLKSQTRYPAPVVRLALMAHIADELGTDGQAALHNFQLKQIVSGEPLMEGGRNLRELVAKDLEVVPQVVASILSYKLLQDQGFEQLCSWDKANFSAYGKVDLWTQGLLGREIVGYEKSRRAARLVISSAIAAWAEVSAITDTQERLEEQQRLAETMLECIQETREDGTRESETVVEKRKAEQWGDELAQALLQANLINFAERE